MGGASASPWKAGKKHKTKSEKEWDEIGRKVEVKVMREVGKWADKAPTEEPEADAGDGAEADSRAARDAEWDEIGRKVEAKIKRKVRKWAEED